MRSPAPLWEISGIKKNVAAKMLHQRAGLLLFVLLFSPTADAQTPASNVEILQTLFGQIAARVDSMVAATGERNLVLAPRAVEAQSPERMLYTSLTQTLAQGARKLFTASDSSDDPQGAKLVVQNKIVVWEIAYRKMRRPGWFRRAPIERTIKVAVDFDLRETHSRRIYFQGVLAVAHRDTLSNMSNQIENQTLPFTLGTWRNTEKRAAWLEPTLLTAATGAIVYAFYSLRSQ